MFSREKKLGCPYLKTACSVFMIFDIIFSLLIHAPDSHLYTFSSCSKPCRFQEIPFNKYIMAHYTFICGVYREKVFKLNGPKSSPVSLTKIYNLEAPFS